MKSAEIDHYIASCSPTHQEAITAIRKIVHDIAPEASEAILYKMPTFMIGTETLCNISSRANYVALYCDPTVVEAFIKGLKGLDVGKSCIRFKKLSEIDLNVVEKILTTIVRKLRAKE